MFEDDEVIMLARHDRRGARELHPSDSTQARHSAPMARHSAPEARQERARSAPGARQIFHTTNPYLEKVCDPEPARFFSESYRRIRGQI
jgi:hypothetical protein